jgi:hypothetical protein
MEHVRSAMRELDSNPVGRGVVEYTTQRDPDTTVIFRTTANFPGPINHLTVRVESSKREDFVYPPTRLQDLAVEYRDAAISWLELGLDEAVQLS